MFARLRIGLTVVFLCVITLLLAPIQLLAIRFDWPFAQTLPLLWHKLAVRLIGLKIIIHGKCSKERPLLLVANHISWMDIPVLGSIAPMSFIAKHEVATMPGASVLAKLQRTTFVEREARRQVSSQVSEISERLDKGDAMVLFAEGTTCDGNTIGEFKSSLFASAQAALENSPTSKVMIQPVSIAYTHLHGVPLGRIMRKETSWIGDEDLLPHALDVLKRGAYTVVVSFGEPIEFDVDGNRKRIAKQTHAEVREMFLKSLHGSGVEAA